MAENTGRKQRGNPFRKGQSGNPAGKPKGARHKTTLLAEKLMQDDGPDVVRKVIEAAKGGDMTAARMVLDRIAPLRKGRPVQFDLPPIAKPADLAPALASIVSAMASGKLTPDEATAVASVIEVERRTLETVEIERRIAALEQRETEGKGR